MLPQLPTVNEGDAGAPVRVPPPPKFRAVLGEVISATLGGHRHTLPGVTEAQRAGLRYEAKVQRELAGMFGKTFFPAPTIFFIDDRGEQIAIPDGLLFCEGKMIVIEIKSQHMPEAWWQLRKKYEPVARKLFPSMECLLLEICRTHDVQMPFPERYNVYLTMTQFLAEAKDGELGVLPWKL